MEVRIFDGTLAETQDEAWSKVRIKLKNTLRTAEGSSRMEQYFSSPQTNGVLPSLNV